MKNTAKKILLVLLSINTGFVVGLTVMVGFLLLRDYSGINAYVSGMLLGHIDFYIVKILCGLLGILTFIYLSKQVFIVHPNVEFVTLLSSQLRRYSLFTILSTALFIWATSAANRSYVSMLYRIIFDWNDSVPSYYP